MEGRVARLAGACGAGQWSGDGGLAQGVRERCGAGCGRLRAAGAGVPGRAGLAADAGFGGFLGRGVPMGGGAGLRDGEFAGLPAADEFLQAVEDAGENSRDQGVQGFGQHSPLVVQGGSGA